MGIELSPECGSRHPKQVYDQLKAMNKGISTKIGYTDPWHVIETACCPDRWKVVPSHTYRERNASYLFHDSQIEAQMMADEMNYRHRRYGNTFVHEKDHQ